VLFVSSGLWTDAPGADVCTDSLPPAVTRVLVERFPSYRLPRSSDNLTEDIEYYTKQGRSGCLGVVKGDFNGDTQPDYALLVTSKDGKEVLLIAALRSGETWQVQKLRTWSGERNRLYVTQGSPGEYRRATYLDDPLEPGEVASFKADRVGIVTGRTEASGIYYFWTPTGWVHVWVVD
jgi:hypothetical protein